MYRIEYLTTILKLKERSILIVKHILITLLTIFLLKHFTINNVYHLTLNYDSLTLESRFNSLR